ncbi:host specificity protein [Bradyrhizobium sp. SSUT112]|uniref:host specificity protein n=2 Tax=Bradyrhizobium TaxID=374 RepID=UPI00244C68C9|nr:host specificity protein [Bradyrhizobium sp. SSUT112]MDH2356428.1 host specificity protein [Bradyrhizobium sp. SSUT112]
MYSRITGSSNQSTTASEAYESGQLADDPTFAGAVAEAAPASSSTTRPYSLTSNPPIVEMDRGTYEQELRNFYGDDVKHIAENPQEYSDFVSSKAERSAMLARVGASVEDRPGSQYFSYRLGDKSVGLLRMDPGFRIKGRDWQEEHFPERKNISSVVALRVTHPLVENAGDVLLEHQLRLDGKKPLIMSRPANDELKPRLEQMGFVDVGGNEFVLDPKRHRDKWTLNGNGEWQRADRPQLYLQAESEDPLEGSSDESEQFVETDSSGDDPSWYLERALTFRGGRDD